MNSVVLRRWQQGLIPDTHKLNKGFGRKNCMNAKLFEAQTARTASMSIMEKRAVTTFTSSVFFHINILNLSFLREIIYLEFLSTNMHQPNNKLGIFFSYDIIDTNSFSLMFLNKNLT